MIHPSLAALDRTSSPAGVAFDADGNLLVAEWDTGRVSRIDPAGKRTTFAYGLSSPCSLTIGTDGPIYVALIPVMNIASRRRASPVCAAP
jgi:sugar lactone lactonase YvrE